MEEFLPVSSGILPPAAETHLERCESCRRLHAVLHSSVPELPSPSVVAAAQQHLTGGLRPVRPLAPAWWFTAAFLAIFAIMAAIGMSRLGAAGWQSLDAAQLFTIFLTIAASAGCLAFSLALQMAPGARNAFGPALLGAGIIVVLLLASAGLFQFRLENGFLRLGWSCFSTGMSYAIPAAIIFAVLLRRGANLNPRVLGASTGALAGLVGVSVLEMHCPDLNGWHIVTWHFGVIAAGAVAGLLAGTLGDSFRRSLR